MLQDTTFAFQKLFIQMGVLTIK